MPMWLVGTVQWLHVLFGIFWFGAVLTLTFVVVPALGRDRVTQLRITNVRPAGGEPDLLAHFQNLWS